ncbi:TRE2 (YOR256C) and TRE1 (YPL176C) [Zygosaccharomyces parabailii]|nr:TRE2 (YOR256C) and TRE1 (YPL176C) [Zygosaccharomyces parabailii]CDH10179.1 related to TRE1-Transferrin receptor-like protein, controls the degradation of a yeast metal transporter;involved in Cell surface polarization during yeast mating [Zygosaccharomyces bailii ISA1307]
MHIHGLRSGYERVPDVEAQEPHAQTVETTRDPLPLNPPDYDDTVGTTADESDRAMEEMDYEDTTECEESLGKIQRFRDSFSNNIVIPVRENIMDPLAQIISIISEKIDFYLNKVGNPLILRRFFYIVLMSVIAYVVMVSGLLPSEKNLGSRGMFSEYGILMDYVKSSLDLSKFERDLEYISSMPHMSGTKGDTAVRNYLLESFTNNGVRLIKEAQYNAYSNYPGEVSLKAVSNDKETIIEVNHENFNPLSKDGTLQNVNLLFANKGSLKDLEKLEKNGLLAHDFVLLMQYTEIVSEQVLAAEKYGAKGILFMTDAYGDSNDVVQVRSVGKPQVWPGDALTPGWVGDTPKAIEPNAASSLPKIPSMPLSWNQGQKLLGMLSNGGVKYADSKFSGLLGDVMISMKVATGVRDRHPVDDILGKIEGAEQNDKAIIIAASRTSVTNGASYPSFGTALMLSILQLFQELKYKFDWQPLRNIYFVSYGGSEFNFAGSVELMEENSAALKDEVYSVIDLSQLSVPSSQKQLDIQSHPLLQDFFRSEENKFGYDFKIRNVQQYGDWIPFMANGVPVSVFSCPSVLESRPPLFTTEDRFEEIKEALHDPSQRQLISDLLLVVFQSVLKIADNPLLPFSVVKYVEVLDESLQELQNNYPGHLDSQEMVKGLLLWKKIGEEWAAWSKGWENIVLARDEGIEPSLLSVHRWTWNKKLANIGKRQCTTTGLPNRSFYKNNIFGPTYWTQAVKGDPWIFPSIKDAVVDGDWQRAQGELDVLARVLQQSAALFLEETNDI